MIKKLQNTSFNNIYYFFNKDLQDLLQVVKVLNLTLYLKTIKKLGRVLTEILEVCISFKITEIFYYFHENNLNNPFEIEVSFPSSEKNSNRIYIFFDLKGTFEVVYSDEKNGINLKSNSVKGLRKIFSKFLDENDSPMICAQKSKISYFYHKYFSEG